MGGHAFKNVDRIKREHIRDTIESVVNTLNFEGFTLEYAMNSFMGSTGKKESSGDIDIAMNTKPTRFVGEEELPVFNKYELLAVVQQKLPKDRIRSDTFRMGILMTLWPIVGDPGKNIQVDFVFGDRNYLQFSHFSPGDRSRFSGVFVAHALGVLAKSTVLYRFPHDAKVDKENDVDERISEVSYTLNLEKGLRLSPRLRNRRKHAFERVSLDHFETHNPEVPPRFPRLGYISCPETIIKILLGNEYTFSEVDTFEKLVPALKKKFTEEEFEVYKERLIFSLLKSSAKHEWTEERLKSDPVWDTV